MNYRLSLFSAHQYSVFLTGGNQHANLRFTDKEVCRPFLLDICINELFTNTVSLFLVFCVLINAIV